MPRLECPSKLPKQNVMKLRLLALSTVFVLAACGDDSSSNNGTNNGANNGVTNNGTANNGVTNNGTSNNGACVPTVTCEDFEGCGTPDDGCGTALDCGCDVGFDCESDVCVLGVGNPCTETADCPAGAECQMESELGWTGGYCTLSCVSSECPTGSHCDGESCVKSCTESSECREPDYGCFDSNNDGSTECAPLGSGAGAVGDACTSYADCAGGEAGACIVESGDDFPGGYCTLANCTDTTGCPMGSTCLVSMSFAVCLKDCADVSMCRTDYQCTTVIADTTSCVPLNL